MAKKSYLVEYVDMITTVFCVAGSLKYITFLDLDILLTVQYDSYTSTVYDMQYVRSTK